MRSAAAGIMHEARSPDGGASNFTAHGSLMQRPPVARGHDMAGTHRLRVAPCRYFQSALQPKAGAQNQLEISVHCDVVVFEWMMQYIAGQAAAAQLPLDQLLPVLIASNFLQVTPCACAWVP